jgi:hypothetical protein
MIMKVSLMTFAAVAFAAAVYAQTDSGMENSTDSPNSPSKANPYQQRTPSNTRQVNPFAKPAQSPASGITQPAGAIPQQNNPFGTTTQPSNTQSHDYLQTTTPSGAPLPQPSTSVNSTDDLIQVQKDALPAPMTQTLQGPTYQGWENSTIYYNRGTNEYSFDVGSGNDVKNYRFDQNGNPVQTVPAPAAGAPTTGTPNGGQQ